jgi:hypothetical protein
MRRAVAWVILALYFAVVGALVLWIAAWVAGWRPVIFAVALSLAVVWAGAILERQ